MRRLQEATERFDIEFPPNPFDLVALGQNTIDQFLVLPRFPEFNSKSAILHMEKQPGGQIATAAVFAARLGLKTRYIGKVGEDENASASLESLRAEALDLSSVVVEPGARNHFSWILVDKKSGERTILWERDPRLNFHPGELERSDVCSGRLLLLDQSDPGAALTAAAWARQAGIPVVADLDSTEPGSADLIRFVDFLIVGEEFLAGFTGIADQAEALQALAGQCPGLVAVTLGARGAMAFLGKRCVHFPACSVAAADSTCAGDVFHGAFVYGLLQNWSLQRIMAFANAAAGLNCLRLGARAGMPRLSEINQAMHAAGAHLDP